MTPPDPTTGAPRRGTPAGDQPAKGRAKKVTPLPDRATTDAGPVPVATAARRGRRAGQKAVKQNSTNLRLPVVGELTLPPPENLAWYGGIAALVALEIVEWPIAIVLALGKVLSDNRHNKALRDLGEALEEAG